MHSITALRSHSESFQESRNVHIFAPPIIRGTQQSLTYHIHLNNPILFPNDEPQTIPGLVPSKYERPLLYLYVYIGYFCNHFA